jgi:hypothetical protein
MNIKPMTEGIIRQRRNLLVFGCILGFTKFADVKIEKLSLLGMDFGELGNPQSLYTGIWVLFIYFAFRFYQYFMQEGLVKIKQSYYYSFEEIVKNTIQRHVKQNHPGCSAQINQASTLASNNWKYSIQLPPRDDAMVGQSVENIAQVFPQKSILLCKVSTVVKIVFNQSVITDYVLPPAFAFIIAIYCFSGGEYSLVNAIKSLINA